MKVFRQKFSIWNLTQEAQSNINEDINDVNNEHDKEDRLDMDTEIQIKEEPLDDSFGDAVFDVANAQDVPIRAEVIENIKKNINGELKLFIRLGVSQIVFPEDFFFGKQALG